MHLCSENKGADLLCGTAQLICAIVFAYNIVKRFSHDAAHMGSLFIYYFYILQKLKSYGYPFASPHRGDLNGYGYP